MHLALKAPVVVYVTDAQSGLGRLIGQLIIFMWCDLTRLDHAMLRPKPIQTEFFCRGDLLVALF